MWHANIVFKSVLRIKNPKMFTKKTSGDGKDVFVTQPTGLGRVVTKISSCRVNTTRRRGIKWLKISFGSIFLLFSNKSSRGPLP